MSATLFPPTKSSGARPPIEPPSLTTFAGPPDDEGRLPYHKLVAFSVEQLLKMVLNHPEEDLTEHGLQLYLDLLESRVALVQKELSTDRLVETTSMPPSFFGQAFREDHLTSEQSEAIKTYITLLSGLQAGILYVRKKIWLLKGLLPSSEA